MGNQDMGIPSDIAEENDMEPVDHSQSADERGDEDVKPESDAVEESDDDDTKETESNESISEDLVIEYLKTNYKTDDSNVICPHEIAKALMESQGIQEAQFAFHLNTLGKVTYWVVHSMEGPFGDIELPGEGFKLIKS